MALLSYSKNKISFQDIEPEILIYNIETSVIETDLFLWKGHGNSSNRTEKQKEAIKAAVEKFLSKRPLI